MSLAGVLYMLLGAGLVAFGVLAAGAADRIRRRGALTASIDAELAASEAPRARRPASKAAHSQTFYTPAARRAPSESFEVVSRIAPRPAAPAPSRPSVADDAMAKDVVAALTSAGYRKAQVAAAVAACEASERVSIESWTRGALRRCARGAA